MTKYVCFPEFEIIHCVENLISFLCRDYPFSAYAKYCEKLTSLPPDTHASPTKTEHKNEKFETQFFYHSFDVS